MSSGIASRRASRRISFAFLAALAPLAVACGGLVTWVDPGSSQGGASSTSGTTNASSSTGAPLPDCKDVDAFDCESEPGCISACQSTPDNGCFAMCRPLTSVACKKSCMEPAPFCPPGFIPEGDGECYTGYCITSTVCLD